MIKFRNEERLTAGKMCSLTILTGPTSFLSFHPVRVFVGRLFDLATILKLAGTWRHIFGAYIIRVLTL